MQVVLEAVADAVSQLILFSVEADETKSVLQNISNGAAGVGKAVQILVNIGEGLAAKYGSDPKIQADMRGAASRLRTATNEMANYAIQIQQQGFSEATKAALMNTARAILENTVLMLQLADSFDVGQITKAGRLVETELENTRQMRSMPDLVEGSRALSHRTLNLVQLSDERIGLLTDPSYKRRLDSANGTLRNDVEPYLNGCKELVSNPSSNPAVRERSESIKRSSSERIAAAVTEIILVCRLSSQHMWDKVSLDINALLRGRLPPLDLLKSIARDLDAEFDALSNAVHNRNNPAAQQALKGIQDNGQAQSAVALTMAEKSDPLDRKGLMDALERLENALKNLRDAANRKMDNPQAPAKDFDQAVQDAKAANKALVDSALAPEDRMLNAHEDVKRDLDALAAALKTHNGPDSKQALKDLERDVQRQGQIGRALADKAGPNARDGLEDAYKRLLDALGKLGKDVPRANERPNDPAAQKEAEADIDEARDLAKALKDVALPPEREIAHKADQLKKDLARLGDALQDGNKEEALPLMKSVPKDIEAQAERVRDFGKQTDDPQVQQEFKNYADELKGLSPPLMQAAKALLADQNNEPALRAYRENEDAINALNGRVVSRAAEEGNRDKEGDLLNALERLKRALNKLLDDTKKQKQPEAVADVKDATQHLNREVDLAKQLADKLPPAQKAAAIADANKLKDLGPKLVADTKNALGNQSDEPSMRKLEQTVQEVKDAANKIPESLNLSPDKQLKKHGRELNDALDALHDAAKNHKADEMTKLTSPNGVPKKLADQAERGAKFANDADTPIRRKQMLADAETLKRLPPPIVAAAQALYSDPSSADKDKALADLIDKAKAANKRLMDPAYALMTPDQRVLKDITDIGHAAKEGNPKETEAVLADLQSDVPEFLASAQAAVGNTNDPALKKVVAETVRDINALHPQIRPAALAAARAPHDLDGAQRRLQALLDQLRNLTIKLADAELNASTEKKIIDTAETMEKAADTLHDAVKRGDKKAANEHLNKLIDDLRKQAELSRQMGALSDDPIRKKKFNDLGDAFEALIPRLKAALQRLAENPYDLQAQKDLDQIMAEIKHLNDELIDTLRAENEAKLQKALEGLQAAAERGDDLAPHLKEVAELLKKHALIAKALAARTTDPKRRRELLQAAKDLEDAIRQIVDASRLGPKAIGEVAGRIMETASSIKTLSDDPIMAAAQQIEQGLARRRKDLGAQPEGSPAHRLLAGAQRIAELMVQLSKAAKEKPMNKKDVIMISRQIAEQVNHVDKAAKDVSANCKDVKLRESLLAYAAPLKNYGVQLKILTAVKASTTDDDKSTKQQLVTCAKGIASCVVASCGAAEACLIKS